MANNLLFGPEVWGKEIVKLWAGIKDAKKTSVASYGFETIPDAILRTPTAISFIADAMDANYNQAGQNQATWRGWTEFYLSSGLNRSGLAYVNQFYRLIVVQASQKFYLTPTAVFYLQSTKTIELDILSFTGKDEDQCYGVRAYWQVDESLADKISFKL